MIRQALIALVAGSIGLGIVAEAQAQGRDPQRPWCARNDADCDGRPDWRDRYYDPPRYRGQPYQTYGSEGFCSYPTPNGPVRGYKPQGKDRCCVETRHGPSCL